MAEKNNLKIRIYGDVATQEKLAFKELLFDCANKHNLTKSPEIEIMVVNKEKIAELNAKHRGKDQPTDVLSFPQSPFETKHKILGSIVVCKEVIAEKNEDMAEVLKHGFLHLLGFDHETDQASWDAAAKKINCNL